MDYRKLASRGKYAEKNFSKVEEYSLQGKQHASFEEVQVGQEIEVISGTIWLTQFGDIRDYTIKSGNCFTITRPGMVLIAPVGNEQANFRMK